MFFLATSSSEAIHKKAIEEFRELDSEAFESIVLHRLCKELDIKLNVFKRNFIIIHYKSEDEITDQFKYFLETDDLTSNGCCGCLGFCWSPLPEPFRSSLTKESTSVEKFSIGRHFRSICEFLMIEENLCTEGIFLKAGSSEAQSKLREQLQYMKPINFRKSDYSVHDCANVLKQYLQQMTEPIFISKLYPAYERISVLEQSYGESESIRRKIEARMTIGGRLLAPDSELKNKEQKILDCIQLVVQLIPQKRKEFLEKLLDILEAVYIRRAYNRMNDSTLGAVFAPLLVCPRYLPREVAMSASKEMSYFVSRLIKIGHDIFDPPAKLRSDVSEYIRDNILDEE